MSKISAEDVLKYRRLYTNGTNKSTIIAELNLNRKTIDNFLFGRTYTNAPEICVPRKYERT